MNRYVAGTFVIGAAVVGQTTTVREYDVWRDRIEAVVIGLVTGMVSAVLSQRMLGRGR